MYLARSRPTVLTWFMDASLSGLQRPHSGTPRPPGASTPSELRPSHSLTGVSRNRTQGPQRRREPDRHSALQSSCPLTRPPITPSVLPLPVGVDGQRRKLRHIV